MVGNGDGGFCFCGGVLVSVCGVFLWRVRGSVVPAVVTDCAVGLLLCDDAHFPFFLAGMCQYRVRVGVCVFPSIFMVSEAAIFNGAPVTGPIWLVWRRDWALPVVLTWPFGAGSTVPCKPSTRFFVHLFLWSSGHGGPFAQLVFSG